jgi:hypothetical protein
MIKLTLSTLLALSLNAITITADGEGKSRDEAIKDALSNLSTRLSVEVKSDFSKYKSVIDGEYKSNTTQKITTSSNLPILSANIDVFEAQRHVAVISELDSKKALKAYRVEIDRLHKEIIQSLKSIKTVKSNDIKYKSYTNLIALIQSFNKHKIVATLLGASNLPSADVSIAKIKTSLLKLQKDIDSLELASIILTEDIKQNNIYINPIKTDISQEITQLARVLKSKMAQRLHTTNTPQNAEFILRGSYEVLKDRIFITTNLYDKNSKIVKTATTYITPKAYKNIDYKVKTLSFDASMNSTVVKSSKLDVSVGFKGYNRVEGIDLKDGDSVDIVVKTNKDICYFMIGHVLHDGSRFSYLLPIGNSGDEWVNRVSGEDVNRYITIAQDIPISAPFGSESLQMFASTMSKDRCTLKVPKCEENSDGYCVIGGKPSQVVKTTRGLNMSKRKQKIEKAESSVSWTSFK